ncbi:SEC-C domain-containing protein [Streptomycetaceae bacterium NBC_01309]
MGKKAARKGQHSTKTTTATDAVPVVGGREPCPCGSGRRYKACHGREAATAAETLVHRPFEGLADECDWVALRELVPAATAQLKLAAGVDDADRSVTLATVLPMAWPALRRDNGSVLIGLQTHTSSGDVSRDLADALERALAAEDGTPVTPGPLPGPGPRLQDLLDVSAPLVVSVHEGFDFWVEDAEAATGDVAASLERANAAATPTARLTSVDAAYWCSMREKNHLRWVMPHPEEELLDAIARLHAAEASSLGEGTRFVGSFRAHGLLVPVWDLPGGMTADDVEKPAADFGVRLAESLADTTPLTPRQRSARNGLLNRQITLN